MVELKYQIGDKPPLKHLVLLSLQQFLSILAGTIAVPAIVGNGMSQSAALFGAGIGTIIYLICTRFRSPVFLGSSFTFFGSLVAAFSGGVSMSLGYLGLIVGAVFSGLVYVIISVIVKFAGSSWIDKVMPKVVIGPVVALIGLVLSSTAISNLLDSAEMTAAGYVMTTASWIELVCGLVALTIAILATIYAKTVLKMIPFLMGIVAGYLAALLFTIIGYLTGNPDFIIIDFSAFSHMEFIPDFAFMKALRGSYEYGQIGSLGFYILRIALAYVPLTLVCFSEHIADHKNLSSIVGTDLLENPGLSRTVLGDGLATMIGGLFGGCPNTTYGESISCVGISGNASSITILCTSVLAIILSFVAPLTTLLSTIPHCVMGGICIATYGFISVSGLKMLQKTNLDDMRNFFVIAVILITGIGSMTLDIKGFTLSSITVGLLLGIFTNILCNMDRKRCGKERKIKE